MFLRNFFVRVARDYLLRVRHSSLRQLPYGRNCAYVLFCGRINSGGASIRSFVPTPQAVEWLRFLWFRRDYYVAIASVVRVRWDNGALFLFTLQDHFRRPEEFEGGSVLRFLVFLRVARRAFFDTSLRFPAVGCYLGA